MVELVLLVSFAIAVGTISSMVGIGGGIINTPLLIIIFMFDEQVAPATALVAALFVAISSTYAYAKQETKPIMVKAGLFLAIATIPGSLVGVALREMITDDMILRVIFGVSLFPVAIKMLLAKKRGKADEVSSFDFSQLTNNRLVLSLIGGFVGGVAAGLLGIGGGAIVVPVLTILMGLPIHAAVATSMFIMIFTASAGTVSNFMGGYIDIFYALSLGIGMLIGAQIGTRLSCKVNAVQLKQVFGLILVFPLVKMMKLGQYWLDPLEQSFSLATIGDILIWLAIIVPIGLIRLFQIRQKKEELAEPHDQPAPE